MGVDHIKKKLSVNQQIEIEVKNGPYKGTYQSKIAEINQDRLKILLPFSGGDIVPLRLETELNVFFTGNDAAYKFYSRVRDRVKEKIHILVIDSPHEIVRIQRRDYFRLDAKLDVKYRKLDQDHEPIEHYIKSQTSDLSGGGIKLVLESELKKDDIIEMLLDIEGIEELPIMGKVRELYDIPDGQAAGIEYIDINRKIRDLIISWMFDYQRELRKKGLL
jgi:c-di-GMP-binding flagellar brake protein YcgR